jgi:hypothetical protein
MSTKAEQQRYAEERKHPSKRDHERPRSSRSGEPGEHENAHAARKASYALEPRSPDGRATRRSTRGSANHQRTDVGELRAETMSDRTPESAHAHTVAADAKSHGKPRPRAR